MKAFTSYKTTLRSQSKLSKVPLEELRDAVKEVNKKYQTGGIIQDITRGILWDMECEILHGNCTNIFIRDANFAQWLADCSPHQTEKVIGPLQHLADKPCCVHFPSNTGWNSIAFCITGDAAMVGRIHTDTPHTNYFLMPMVKGEIDLSEAKHSKLYTQHLHCVLGLACYCDAFPEMVIEGVPWEVKAAGNCPMPNSIAIDISPKVRANPQGGTHASPTGHFRCGHFRVLKSEKYTHKRFQSVFVHSCFVKGDALTVIEA